MFDINWRLNWNRVLLRVRALVFRRRVEGELDEELQFHLAMQARKNRLAGLSEPEARRRARVEFGGFDQAKEGCRDTRGVRSIEMLSQDIRYALRGFRRTPGFALTVIVTIALGLGLNTTFFTIFNAYVLRPLAVRDPHSLYQFTRMKGDDVHLLTWHEYQDFQGDNPAFSEVLGYQPLFFTRVQGHALFGDLVTGNYFGMLGVTAALGRTLLPEDAAAPGSGAVIVLSSKAWKSKFGGDPQIIGKKLIIHGYPLEVVGVARAGFNGLGEIPLDFWSPITAAPHVQDGPSLFGAEQPEEIRVIGRLRPGWSVGQAKTALTGWAHQRSAGRPPVTGVILRSEATTVPLDPLVLAAFSPVFVAFGLVLLIACANVANMMLARAMARQREIGIRLAIGAARSRIIRQLLTESVLLALPAAMASFCISAGTIQCGERLLFATLPGSYAEFINVVPLEPDLRVFGFMLLAAVLSALLFGLAPAIQATRSDVVQAARGEFTTDFRPARLRNALVVAQVTVSVLLLILAAVLLRANNRIESRELGLTPRGVVEIEIRDRFRAKVIQALESLPDADLIAAASKVPFEGSLPWVPVAPDRSSEQKQAGYLHVTPEYFSIFQLPILRGRNFTVDEARAGAPVAIISRATAQRLWPSHDALGRSFRIVRDARQRHSLAENPKAGVPPYAEVRVIGIARDAVNGYVGDGTDATCIYFPGTVQAEGYALLVRVKGDAGAARNRLDLALASSLPGIVDRIHGMDEVLSAQLFPYRALYWVSSAVGGLALLLTLSGIYGVLSYLVTQRTKEIGIRVALGASTARVASLVLRQSLKFAATGTVIGTITALGVSRVLASQLDMFMFDSVDGVAFAVTAVLVLIASTCAAWYPSRRAARIAPVTTLRYD